MNICKPRTDIVSKMRRYKALSQCLISLSKDIQPLSPINVIAFALNNEVYNQSPNPYTLLVLLTMLFISLGHVIPP